MIVCSRCDDGAISSNRSKSRTENHLGGPVDEYHVVNCSGFGRDDDALYKLGTHSLQKPFEEPITEEEFRAVEHMASILYVCWSIFAVLCRQ